MTEEYDHTTSTTETEQEATRYTVEETALPSLWSSIRQAFQQARLARLEARVRRLRRYAMGPPVASHPPVVILTAERTHPRPEAEWTPVLAPVPRRCIRTLVTIIVGALGGIALSQLPLRPHGITAEAVTVLPQTPRELPPPRETAAMNTTLATLEERLIVLRQQVDQHGDQLTNQTSALESMSQQTDTQRTQLTTLVDALAAISAQVQQVEQQLTAQATRVAAHEKRLARQATQRSKWREPTEVSSVVPVDHGRLGPPTLELFAPPATPAPAPVPNATPLVPASSVAPPTGQTPRRTITLPASLGAVGLRTTTGTTGGPQP